MAAQAARRISVGFQGGQIVGARVSEEELKSLNRALDGGGGGWHEIASEDGPVRVNLGQVAYVSAESEELHVGFG
jgi:hypothetical protein